MCVILSCGNRKHLRVLENRKHSAEAFFTFLDGRVVTYRVSDSTIFENTSEWRLPSTAGNTLGLVPFYTFHHTGHLPGKDQEAADLIN